jgi:hypothetical protein
MVLLGVSQWAWARIPPVRDARLGVLDATLVAITHHQSGDLYKIDEILLGVRPADGIIEVPAFCLYTVQQWGPEKTEPITERTRILMFLKPKREDGNAFEVTSYGYCFFWVQDPDRVPDLRRIGMEAVNLRRSWEKARDVVDPQQRVTALWPYLWDGGSSFLESTKKELQKTGVTAGDYMAQMLPTLNHGQRMTLLPHLGLYGGTRLHAWLIQHLRQRQALYEASLSEYDPNGKGPGENWDRAPDQIKEISAELYYGLTGLDSFHDRQDLDFMRDLTLWAVKYRFQQTCEAALLAFRYMPDEKNLPVIAAAWREFSSKPIKGSTTLAFGFTRALQSHKYAETVPILTMFLSNPDVGTEARGFLTKIVGVDLGGDPGAWLAWYEAQRLSATKAPSQSKE